MSDLDLLSRMIDRLMMNTYDQIGVAREMGKDTQYTAGILAGLQMANALIDSLTVEASFDPFERLEKKEEIN
jgi:hypothetical protein